jgi:cell division protein FtsL
LNRLGNTYWLSNRQATQRVAAQTIPMLPVRDISREVFPVALGWLRIIPSWMFLAMILMATLAICSTVIIRSTAELNASTTEYGRINSEIASIRRSNTSLQVEIRRMASDPSTIESAARERLGMVRPNDVVVPIESIGPVSNFGTLSFVR